MRDTLKTLLLEELENKKPFSAHWDCDCDVCGDSILEEETFYFFGDKQKVCPNCFNEMAERIEDNL